MPTDKQWKACVLFSSEIETNFLLLIVVLFIKAKKEKLDIVQETREINCEAMEYYSATKKKTITDKCNHVGELRFLTEDYDWESWGIKRRFD